MTAVMITLILAGLLRGVRTQRSLVLENLALRHLLVVPQRTVPRPRLRTVDRLFWVLLCCLWAVCPLRRPTRHCDPVAAYRLPALLGLEEPPERAGPSGRRAGGPRAYPTMARANPLWGGPRIHGELQKLGFEISQATVSKYLGRGASPVADLAHVSRQPYSAQVLTQCVKRRLRAASPDRQPWVSSLRSLQDRPRHRSVSTPGMVIPRGGCGRGLSRPHCSWPPLPARAGSLTLDGRRRPSVPTCG
jgi:hypothetical protein